MATARGDLDVWNAHHFIWQSFLPRVWFIFSLTRSHDISLLSWGSVFRASMAVTIWFSLSSSSRVHFPTQSRIMSNRWNVDVLLTLACSTKVSVLHVIAVAISTVSWWATDVEADFLPLLAKFIYGTFDHLISKQGIEVCSHTYFNSASSSCVIQGPCFLIGWYILRTRLYTALKVRPGAAATDGESIQTIRWYQLS